MKLTEFPFWTVIIVFSLVIGGTAVIGCTTSKIPSPATRTSKFEDLCATIMTRTDPPPSKWFFATTEPPKGTVLVVHGLNNKPEIMNSLIQELNKASYHALRITLSGHEKGENSKHSADPSIWIDDVRRGYCRAKDAFPSHPLLNLSYSTGAAVSIAFLDKHHYALFDKMVLFAPSVSLRSTSYAPKLITGLRAFDLSLPSFAPEKYRQHHSTSLHSYNALFKTISAVQELSRGEAIGKIETLVFISPTDEFVSLSRLRNWKEKNHLVNWKVEKVYPRTPDHRDFFHLIIDEPSLGTEEWTRVREMLKNFLF